MPLLVDEAARQIAITRWGLPECIHVPIAAADETAIRAYIGEAQPIGGPPYRAFLVIIPHSTVIDPLLPISCHPNVGVLFARRQLWVNISYDGYRSAYRKAFSGENIDGRILSHAMNRRTAALKGFDFVRVTLASRANNSSSSFSEKWGVELHSSERAKAIRGVRPPYIQYADLSDLMLMLDMRIGGGIMDAVNEGQKLVEPRTNAVGCNNAVRSAD
ncbi:hypothetical protein BJ123_105114 [Rhodopseudomonas thermotolerans]|uniref:Uncharacterized protein n=2 Tax=Rhodopseudomonas TaxID=1073 RepID=A0A336JK25_9BRAD|nr:MULTISPECIES: hypothetical protein [Rhodopseudomonas]RED38035.1 hypothetical protein BJ125_105114 [Rhodopseudomonas pentothenatexigens]REG05228.1 hypothetical protein BJ123_105114 [Rhodopseudomonas thermotolerans]SSW90060.1 hypothetical protein SAMN05892882_105114 [Rhodopseudomonas pentothenatexigens]